MALTLTVASLCEAVWFKIFLYGNSGAGKTWRAVQARKVGDPRKVLALLTEANGVQSARHAKPDLLLPSWPMTRKKKNTATGLVEDMPVLDEIGKPMIRHFATSMPEVREVILAVQNREVEVDTLVIDGLTEIQALMKEEMIKIKKQMVQEGKADKKALIFSISDWGELQENMRRFMRSLRDLPVHVINTALAEVETAEGEGESTIRFTIPSFQGKKLHNQAASYHNVVAYCYTSTTRNDRGVRVTERMAMVEGPETIQCKPAFPLGGILDIPLWEWLDLLAKPPEDGQKVGKEMTPEQQKALDASLAEGAKQSEERKKKEEAGEKPKTTPPEEDADLPQVDLTGGEGEKPKGKAKGKEEKPKGTTGETTVSSGRIKRNRQT